MRRLLRALLCSFYALFLLTTPLASAAPHQQSPTLLNANLTTAFTYQGRLEKASELVTANCSMTFALFDAATNGTQIGSSQTINPVIVDAGLFSVALNGAGEFGANAFEGSARFLQIAILCPGDSSAVTMPRQQLTAAPYALTSLSTQGLQGRPVSAIAPSEGQALAWDGSQWTPQTFSGGDITGVVVGNGLTGGGTSGDVNVTLDTEVTDNRYWQLGGNDSVPATGFLGTTNSLTLTLATSNTTALRLMPTVDTTTGEIIPTLLGGHRDNSVAAGVAGAIVAGGASNQVRASFATIPGGAAARASLHGQFAYAAGGFVADNAPQIGSAQTSIYLLRNEGVGDLTLFLDGEDDTFTLRPGSSMVYSAYIIGRSTTATEFSAAYRIDGLIFADDDGTTVNVAGVPLFTEVGESNFAASLGVSTTAIDGALRINVDNDTGHAMRWVATVYTTEVAEK